MGETQGNELNSEQKHQAKGMASILKPRLMEKGFGFYSVRLWSGKSETVHSLGRVFVR